ncbi:hypothetical protein ACOSQ3_030463 [Xanthoceras sorbifolium]
MELDSTNASTWRDKRIVMELDSTNASTWRDKLSRATPTIVHDGDDHDLLIIGVYGPAFVIAVKRSTGKLVWSTQLDHNPAAVITIKVDLIGLWISIMAALSGLLLRLDLVAFEEEETGELPLMKRGSMQILSTQTGKNFTLKPSNKTATSAGTSLFAFCL